MEIKIKSVPMVIATCCVLHNICETRNVAMCEDVVTGSIRYPQPPTRPSRFGNADAAAVRDALKKHICETLPFRASQRFANI